MSVTGTSASVTSYKEATKSPQDKQTFWQTQIIAAEKEMEKFWKRGNQVTARYLDERGTTEAQLNTLNTNRRFNLFHANVNIMKAALYAKLPEPEVKRRFNDPDDDVARVASKILERNLMYELDNDEDCDEVFKAVVLDRLLPGLGAVWLRYEAATTKTQIQVNGQPVDRETIDYECTPLDYVYWEDLMWSPARTWREVWWVARKVYLQKDEGIKRFGEKFNNVMMDKVGRRQTEAKTPSGVGIGPTNQVLKKGCVYEIWNKKDKKVLWVAKGLKELLDEKSDFLKLPRFFPTPKPLFASTTSSNLIPMADYMLCQDQYEELDVINTRISYLVQACKLVGVYDKKADGVQRMLQQGVENQLIPVDQWAAFAEKGGIKGSVDWLPIDQVVAVIQQLNLARDTIKQQIYELTGLSDIIRGASAASETAAAQKIKAQYASVRLTTQQEEVAAFLTDVFHMKACLMCKHYQPDKLIMQAGKLPPEDEPLIKPAIQLLKDYYAAQFRVEVSSDTFTDVEWQRETEERMEFLMNASQFIEKAASAAMEAPETAPMMFGLLKFAVAGFRASKDVEGIIDQGAAAAMQALQQKQAQPPQPSPEEMKAKAEMEQSQMEHQQKTQQTQQKHDLEMAELQAKMASDKALNDAKVTMMQEELQFMREKFTLELQAMREKMGMKVQETMINAAAKTQAAAQEHEQNMEASALEHAQGLQQSQETHEVALKQAAEAKPEEKTTKE